MHATAILREILTTELKFLAFQRIKPDFRRYGNHYLAFGLVSTWLAGVGRYWDNPRAELWQYAGLGSLAYVLVLSLVLYLLLKPLSPENWHYKSILIFVGMTSPPAILYAIPVERFLTIETAQMANVWFLAIVAIWRVALLFLYLRRSAKLSGLTVVVAALLPLVIIVSLLALLNLEHVVFNIMAGLGQGEGSSNDAAYGVLVLITTLSLLASPVLLTCYLVIAYQKWKSVRSRSDP
ncbi:MAG: hypothetical protein AAF497_24015 [Planctomycetota bacterium]